MNKKTQGKLTRKERKAVKNAEKARIEEERRATELHYRIIQSTQDILPVKDILNGVVITKDGRYVKLLEFKPVNFMYMEPESQERLISTFASMLQAVSVNIQFKAISKKADVESMISTVKEIHDKETDASSVLRSPGTEAMRAKLKKYDAAYKTLTAENAALNKQSAVYKAQER